MADILDDIVLHKRKEIALMMAAEPEDALRSRLENAPLLSLLPSMRAALLASPTGIISEFKRKSPSKGWINEEAKVEDVPLAYPKAGATALSILTDAHFFGGDDAFIGKAQAAGVTLPVLYKNFVLTPYQILKARLAGASAVLLIAAILTKDDCRNLIQLAHSFGMEVLLEMHNERDLEYAELAPDMYGINNRHLGSFVTDVQHSFDLVDQLPKDVCTVSESGIDRPETILALRQAGFKGFLIGEAFMRTAAPGDALRQFIAAL